MFIKIVNLIKDSKCFNYELIFFALTVSNQIKTDLKNVFIDILTSQ